MKLVAYQCPTHEKFWSLCLERCGSGTRLFGGKCCLNQYAVPKAIWNITGSKRQEMIDELMNDDAMSKGE